MAVPDYQSLMLPLLQFAARKSGEISTSEGVDALAIELGLSDEDLKEMLPSGIQATFFNRIKEDKLGLDVVYIQAKRWDNNPVGRPDVMQFGG